MDITSLYIREMQCSIWVNPFNHGGKLVELEPTYAGELSQPSVLLQITSISGFLSLAKQKIAKQLQK